MIIIKKKESQEMFVSIALFVVGVLVLVVMITQQTVARDLKAHQDKLGEKIDTLADDLARVRTTATSTNGFAQNTYDMILPMHEQIFEDHAASKFTWNQELRISGVKDDDTDDTDDPPLVGSLAGSLNELKDKLQDHLNSYYVHRWFANANTEIDVMAVVGADPPAYYKIAGATQTGDSVSVALVEKIPAEEAPPVNEVTSEFVFRLKHDAYSQR
jgi:hypothetical protein